MRSHWNRQDFIRFFDNSKVVNERGEPKRVYHATPFQFDAFTKGDLGFHFGTKSQAAQRHDINRKKKVGYIEDLERWPLEGRTIPVYLSIQNPLRMPDIGPWDDPYFVIMELIKEGVITRYEASRLETAVAEWENNDSYADSAPIRSFLSKIGHDGIVYVNVWESDESEEDPEGDDSWIAFYPHQIKSAIGNVGGYSSDTRFWY